MQKDISVFGVTDLKLLMIYLSEIVHHQGL